MSKGTKAASGEPGAAARAEVADEPRTLEAHGLTLTLPPRLPFEVLRYMSDEPGAADVVGILRVVLGAEQLDKVWALGLDVDEGTQLVEDITGLYGSSVGESAASPKS